ncbi:hypothetical protein EU803_16000 [Loktanella sp. IMCC34160]|uniref:hypothetical protein n=1 Tax=Loktanella sp. IMCC34160 TaxID=2510646 RepID=UPI00101C95C2|nr:hypothetical protein [Loktanella sp. IMCC34160]RYG89657.1 hypothetical protein EU803_16000 [Loktanella sp. IMCC34160]
MTHPTLVYTRFPVLRSAFSEEFETHDDDAFAQAVEAYFEDWTVDELEINFRNFGRTLGRGLNQVGNVAARAAPGALSGAMQGATMGAALGPYGMLAGAALGAIGGGIASYSQSGQRNRPGPAAPRPAAAPAPRPAQMAGHPAPAYAPVPQGRPQALSPPPAAAPSQSQAMTAQLIQLLSRPEVIQALLSLSVGAMGRRNIQVGNQTVPPEQVLDAIAFTLGGRVASATDTRESWTAAPGGEVLEAMARSNPEDHPFGQTLAMIEADIEDQMFFDAADPAFTQHL